MTTHDMIVWAPLFRQTRGSKLTNLDSGSINQPTNIGMTGMSLNHLGSLSPVTFIFLGWVQVSHRIRFYWVTMPDRMYTWYLLIDMWVVGASQWVTAILVFIAIRLLVNYCYIESATGWVDISKNCAANSVSLQKNAQLINQGGTPMHVCGGFSKYVPKKTSTTICLETQP